MELSIDLLTATWHIFQGSYVEFVGWVGVSNQNKYKNPCFSTSEGPKSAIFESKWYLVQTPKIAKIETHVAFSSGNYLKIVIVYPIVFQLYQKLSFMQKKKSIFTFSQEPYELKFTLETRL